MFNFSLKRLNNSSLFYFRFISDTEDGRFINSENVCYHLPSFVTTFLRLLPPSFVYYHLPSFVTTFFRLLPPSFVCYHFPSFVTTFLRLLPPSFVCYHLPSFVTTFLRLLPLSFVCYHLPSFVLRRQIRTRPKVKFYLSSLSVCLTLLDFSRTCSQLN